MATDPSFVEYILDQAKRTFRLTARKMFGEYALYANGKVVALTCDNRLFPKDTQAGRAALGDGAREGAPYPGAKGWLVKSIGKRFAFLFTRWLSSVPVLKGTPVVPLLCDGLRWHSVTLADRCPTLKIKAAEK